MASGGSLAQPLHFNEIYAWFELNYSNVPQIVEFIISYDEAGLDACVIKVVIYFKIFSDDTKCVEHASNVDNEARTFVDNVIKSSIP